MLNTMIDSIGKDTIFVIGRGGTTSESAIDNVVVAVMVPENGWNVPGIAREIYFIGDAKMDIA